ncbi:MAG TPA: ATP-binding cassette domain-containing protein [Bacteroidales bacterium]|nr:ATP-binding cassette domain-containing protein [Bacteroidales bacterium]
METSSTLLVETSGLNVYQEDTKILDNVNIKVDVGDLVYFIGKVGSGKSSLIKTLYAELPVIKGQGTINVAGFSIDSLKSKQIPLLRRKIGMVFQDFELMADRNVFENLNFVLRATDWKDKNDIEIRINEVLESVGMLEKKYMMPSKLSGGEKQSVSIARALLNNPPVIFADEPTGNLDPESAAQVIEILCNLTESGKAVIIVTHNYNILKKFPGRIYMFENGTAHEHFDEGIDIGEL